MPKRVAVVTDAISAEFSFPYWYRYYGELFGPANLFIITYAGKARWFDGFAVGGLVQLPVGYDEPVRAEVVGRFVAWLLTCYDVVIRTDTDEFLVVDVAVAPTLAAYVQAMPEPYLTVRGFDVIQVTGEGPLQAREGLPMLRDRAYAYPNTALNKTSIVTTPLRWSAGFHWADVFPLFGPVFMLHMKRIDLGWQMACLQQITVDLEGNQDIDASVREYFKPDAAKIAAYHAGVSGRPRLSGMGSWYRNRLITGFLAGIMFDPKDGLYSGQYGHEEVLCEIPWDWKRII